MRKYDGRRGEGVGLGNDDKGGRRVHCSKFLPVGRGVVNAVTGDDFYDGVGVGGRGRKGSGRRVGIRGGRKGVGLGNYDGRRERASGRGI